MPPNYVHVFAKYQSIFKILSLAHWHTQWKICYNSQ